MSQTRLPFELDQRAETGALTAHGGVPLVIEAFRVSGAAAVVDEQVSIKRRQRGLRAIAAGGRAVQPVGRRRRAL